MPSVFSASDIEKGYFQFVWIDKRILHSKKIYEAPYFLEAEISYAEGSSRAGIVLWVDLPGEAVQEPHHGDPGFNSEGIALYPTEEGDSMIVQFTGAFVHHNTPVTQIKVPKPDTASSLKGLNTYRIEDYDSAVYVFLNEAPFFLVELDDKTGPIYSSGTVYNAAMDVMGTFSDMEINDVGKVSICQRDATLRLYSAKMQTVDLKEQSIIFNQVGVRRVSDEPFRIEASASSGLPVSLSLVSGPATLEGDMVSLSGEAGVVDILISQPGDNEYLPESLNYTFYVSRANSEKYGVPVTGLLICCRGNDRGPFYINGQWRSNHDYKDINQVRGILSNVQEAGINVVCVDMTNPSQWTVFWDIFSPMVENIRTVCAEKNMEYFIMIGAVVSNEVREDLDIPASIGHLEWWNDYAQYILENWAQDSHYRTYGFGDERKIINMFYPGILVRDMWNSTPDEHKTYLSKFYRGTHEYNEDFTDTPTDGWGYRDVQQSSDGKVRCVSPTDGLHPSTSVRISAQQWADRLDWVSGASHYSVYGSYDDNNDNIHWGINDTKNATSDIPLKYPEDDPYYYYSVLKDKLTSGPYITFQAPLSDDRLEEEDILEVEVEAEDSDSIARIELFINGTLVGADSVVPYQWGPEDSLQTKLIGGNNTLEAVATDKLGISTKTSIRFYYNSTVGISNGTSEAPNPLSVYPNPTRDILNIRYSDPDLENAAIEIYNMAGTRVLSLKLSEAGTGIHITHLPSGMYALKTILKDRNYMNKFIVN